METQEYKGAVEQVVAAVPPEIVAETLVNACMILSAISRGEMPVPPPGSPMVAILSLLDASGCGVQVCKDKDEAQKLLAESMAKGIPGSFAEVVIGAPSRNKMN